VVLSGFISNYVLAEKSAGEGAAVMVDEFFNNNPTFLCGTLNDVS
jgi:hypothetical protein